MAASDTKEIKAEEVIASPSSALPKHVDLGGDTNLLIGPDGNQVRVRVSKALLSFASKYFQALFSSNFKEGGVAQRGDDIVLAEDDSDAMIDLCKILHMQYTTPKHMSPVELLYLAYVADKYGCVKALQLTLDALFPPDANDWKFGVWATCNLIAASYLLDHPARFSKYTRIICITFSDSLANIGLSTVGQLVPAAAWLHLESRRSEVLRGIIAATMALLKKPCNGDLHKCPKMCEWYTAITTAVRAAGLSDINASNDTISNLMNMAQKIVVPGLNGLMPHCGTTIQPVSSVRPFHPHPISHAQFTKMLTDCGKKCRGLCLDCVRAGGKYEGKCGMPHD